MSTIGVVHALRGSCLAIVVVPALSWGGGSLDAQAAPSTPSTVVEARDAWVREATGGARPTAGFLLLENQGGEARSVVRGDADAAGIVELHEMKFEDSMMRMSPVETIAIPAGGLVELRPGGLHLMLYELKGPLRAGDTVNLVLTLDDGTTVAVVAEVRSMRGMP